MPVCDDVIDMVRQYNMTIVMPDCPMGSPNMTFVLFACNQTQVIPLCNMTVVVPSCPKPMPKFHMAGRNTYSLIGDRIRLVRSCAL